MSKRGLIDRKTGKGIKWPCWNSDTQQWCWCNSHSMYCKARGVKIGNFTGPQSSDEKYSNHPGFLGSGVSTWKVLWWGVGALVILAVVGKGVKVYKQAKRD